MHRTLPAALTALVLLLMTCAEPVNHNGKTPVAEVDGAFLYREDLQAMMPLGISPADSAAYAERCIRDWLEDQLLYQQAEHNIRSDRSIEQMVQEYRRTLIMQEYQQQLIEQKLSDEVTEEQMRAFYDSNPALFVLKEPAIRGLFIKAPRTAANIDDLKRWYTRSDAATLEKIEKYCFHNAVIYEYFYDHWVPLSDLDGKLKADLIDLDNHLTDNKNFEAEDDEYCYLLHVEDFVLDGKVKPYDLARGEIANLLINRRKVDYMEQVRNDLYDRSVQMGRVKRYDNENEENN